VKTVRTPLFAAALLASVASLGLSPAFAQATPAPAASAAAPGGMHHNGKMGWHGKTGWMMPGQFVEGRIAFLKAELKITPAQEAQWNEVAAAMRQNANALDQQITTARQHRSGMDAIGRLTTQAEFAKLRAENDARLVTALKPLYSSLSPQQQQMANALIAPQHGWHHGWHHRA